MRLFFCDSKVPELKLGYLTKAEKKRRKQDIVGIPEPLWITSVVPVAGISFSLSNIGI